MIDLKFEVVYHNHLSLNIPINFQGINIRQLLQKEDQTEELQDLMMGQMKFKKESHYLELGETGLTKNLSTTGG